jgi:hypothetical protein
MKLNLSDLSKANTLQRNSYIIKDAEAEYQNYTQAPVHKNKSNIVRSQSAWIENHQKRISRIDSQKSDMFLQNKKDNSIH